MPSLKPSINQQPPCRGTKGNQIMTILRLYRDEQSDPKYNAQRNLDGRTHYVDDDTLHYHHSRILTTLVIANGLYFGIVESVALDMHNRSRGYRHVIFNLFGTVVTRSDLEHCAKTSKTAYKALIKQKTALESNTKETVFSFTLLMATPRKRLVRSSQR